MNITPSMPQYQHADMPLFPGNGFIARAANSLRRRFPQFSHAVIALLRISITDRYSSMIWTAALRPSPQETVIVADKYSEALEKLLNIGGTGSIVLCGMTYDVRPAQGTGFNTQPNAITRRNYSSYDEYLRHQKSKLDREYAFVSTTSNKRYGRMSDHFQHVISQIKTTGPVLCLASRLGEEVRAYRDLGLMAVGIDLNPGKNNPYTLYGDFHDVKFPDATFDLVYCNSLDHVLDIDRFMREAVRVVRSEGHIFFDLSGGYQEIGAIDPYGASFWETNDALIAALAPYIREMRIERRSEHGYGRHIVFTVKRGA